MAAGDGGFSTALSGFNKNEVNEYIGRMSKEKLKLETDLKAAEDKIKAAEKRAEEAEAKIAASKEESDKQIAELHAQVKEERKKSEEFVNQIDELKRKIKNSGGLKNDPNAEKQAEEIIANAKKQAAEIIANAQKTAPKSAAPAVDTAAFMAALNSFKSVVTSEIQKFSNKAGEILKTPVTAASSDAQSDFMSMENSFFADMDDTSDGINLAAAAFGMDDMAAMPDMSDMGMVSEVTPLDDPEKPKHEMVDSFDNVLIAQTVPSSELSNDMLSGANDMDIGGTDGPVGFDMGVGADNSQSELDAMNALLGQMSASLESSGGSMDSFDDPQMNESNPAADDNPWANLQAQLDAMEMSGDFGSDEQGNETQPDITSEAQKAPSADDSNIWNFGMDSASDDDMSGDMNDDMSADLFGSF